MRQAQEGESGSIRRAIERGEYFGCGTSARSSQTWAMLIKRIYEVDPLCCPQCGGEMKVVAFIEPPQGDVIEEILNGHQSGAMVGGLWQASSARAPPDVEDLVLDLAFEFSDSPIESPDQTDESQELTYVDIDTFLASF